MAALGLNILVGYCGQISLGTGGFMAVGAYASYKLTTVFFPDLGMIFIFLMSGLVAAAVGVLFGLPSLRIKGFYLAVATLAAQFFLHLALQQGAVVLQLQLERHDRVAAAHAVRLDHGAGRLARGLELPQSAGDEPARDAADQVSVRARPWWWCSRWSPRTWCAGASGARGWRSATWTSPPS